jgi:hypothetical protein
MRCLGASVFSWAQVTRQMMMVIESSAEIASHPLQRRLQLGLKSAVTRKTSADIFDKSIGLLLSSPQAQARTDQLQFEGSGLPALTPPIFHSPS